jgi:hypothetical protein
LEGELWTGDINLHVARKIQSSSSPLEIQDLPFLRSKRLRRSAIVVSLRMPASLGPLNLDRMLEFGAGYLKMNAALLSVALPVTAPV